MSNCDTDPAAKMLPLLKHLQNPQNLISYMMFTAWLKFMGVASYIPTITVGG